MKKLTNVFLLAGAVFISSCILATSNSESGTKTETTSVTTNTGTGSKTTSVSTIPGSEYNGSPNAVDKYKVETVTGTGYFDVNKDNEGKVYPKIGKVLKTKYFDVKVDKVIKSDGITLGVPMVGIESVPGKGYRYLTLVVTVKNNDKENRKMFSDGFLYVYSKDKRYKFEINQSVSGDGFGIIKEDIHPSQSIGTNMLYKIATDIKGAAYFQPEKSNMDARISLGNI